MCGISLVASVKGPIPDSVIGRMVDRLAHRGPDGSGIRRLEGCDLGHARLSIIDLATGSQPMSDTTGRRWITFNGEIYNYRQLREELLGKGFLFATRSDTEVILAAYEAWGPACLDRFRGIFAFALWDIETRTLFAARDLFGEKPFFYSAAGGEFFLAASEIKALVASGMVSPRLDRGAVDAYLTLGYVPPDRTIYENVHVLPPGHVLTWRGGEVAVSRYWSPRFETSPISLEDAAVRLKSLLREAVGRQMVADVPVGAFLSGGLDSSTVVALMEEHATSHVQTFSAGFGKWIDELPYARLVAERYGTDHHEMDFGTPPVAELLERMQEVYDEPFADSSNIPTYLLCSFARQHVKVVLSGDGGDELFGGYWWYPPIALSEKDPGSVWRWAALKLLARVLGGRRARLSLRSVAAGLSARSSDPWERCAILQTQFKSNERRKLWGKWAAEVSLVRARRLLQANRGNHGSRPGFFLRPEVVPSRRHPGEGGPRCDGSWVGDADPIPGQGPCRVRSVPAGGVEAGRGGDEEGVPARLRGLFARGAAKPCQTGIRGALRRLARISRCPGPGPAGARRRLAVAASPSGPQTGALRRKRFSEMDASDARALARAERCGGMRNEAIVEGAAAPKVTVLMAVHNGVRYLRQSVESILRQTLADFEFLIVDDGSTDGSRDILLSYADDRRVRLVENPSNLGLTRSLNRGLSLARGALVARQDADDVSHPDRLARQAAFLDAHPDTALVGTQVRHIGQDGRVFPAPGWEKALTGDGIRWQLMFDSPFVHSTVLFRRDVVWGRLGGYDESFRTSQDYELWTRVAAENRVTNLPEDLLDFRAHGEGVSAKYSSADVRKVESVILKNVRRYLDCGDRFDEWPALWDGIVNSNVLGEIAAPGRAVDIIRTMHGRFIELRPEASGSAEIRRHLAYKLVYVASYLATRDRWAAVRSITAAWQADHGIARSAAAKLGLLLLFGETARSMRTVFRRRSGASKTKSREGGR